ncbi:MAG: flagellar hook-associated protein FlgK [Candidatus Eisenbacteria bacterium]
MPGLSHTLEIARRAMMAQQAVMSVIGNNIANAGTAGYSRQIARLEAERPLSFGQIQFGDGVVLRDVERRRDLFLDQQVHNEMGSAAWWEARAERLGGIEAILGEPSDEGLGAALDAFWSSWSELSAGPEDRALRSTVREAGRNLALRLQQLDAGIASAAAGLDAEIDAAVPEVNRRLALIADLNRRIVAAEQGGAHANDLRDQRDLIVDELSQWADFRFGEREDGSLLVRLDGVTLVDRDEARQLSTGTRTLADGGRASAVTLDGAALGISGGRLGSLLELREQTVPSLQQSLDLLARDLAAQVNALHRAGPSGADFFAGTSAADVRLSAEVEADLGAINVSTSGLSGENDVALAIAQLQTAHVIDGATASAGEYWSAFVGRLGTMTQEAGFQQTNATLAGEALSARRESIKGVSLDEETANMVQAQQAFLAAARLFEVTADLFDALLEV